MIGEAEEQMARTGIRLLWGTANLFSHPRYAAGAATNPDPEVFAYAAAQVNLGVLYRNGQGVPQPVRSPRAEDKDVAGERIGRQRLHD